MIAIARPRDAARAVSQLIRARQPWNDRLRQSDDRIGQGRAAGS